MSSCAMGAFPEKNSRDSIWVRKNGEGADPLFDGEGCGDRWRN